MADSKRRRIAGPIEASFTARHATEKVPVGVDYTQVLRTPNASPAASLMGVMLGVLTFMVLTPLVSQAMAAHPTVSDDVVRVLGIVRARSRRHASG